MTYWNCKIINEFPFYIIKENLCILPIYSKQNLEDDIYTQGYSFDTQNSILYGYDKFSIYDQKSDIKLLHSEEIKDLPIYITLDSQIYK